MIVLSANNLTKTYGTDVILEKVSFHINKGDRVGIVGVNGAGKTTLLRMLTGELACDGGEFFVSGDLRVGFLKQDSGFDSEGTVIEEVKRIFTGFYDMEKEMERLLAAIDSGDGDVPAEELVRRYDEIHERYTYLGGYTYKSEMTGILASMAFGEDMFDTRISTLSGGEKTRLALACLLMSKPDILLLDEPTNHLDIGTLKWLEQYLKSYKGTIILVSHDRYFLDETVNRIFEVSNRKLSIYEGNYSFYAGERKSRREAELKHYEKQQKEIRRQEDMIRRFKERGTEKLAKRAASREKMLSSMERLERPDSEAGTMKIRFHENFQSGNDVLFGEGLAKSFFDGTSRKRLFENVDFDIKRGEKICIIGNNGIGKTTLLRMINGEIPPTEGRIKIGYNVQIAYYDQGQENLNPNSTVIGELQDAYHLYSDGELRNMLGRFMFRGDTVFQTVESLSGGERARLSLLKLMMAGANLLILDEPTNHLDIESKEIFEEAVADFPGTCIIVSHDRYLLNRVPSRILEITESGMKEYLGKYNYYLEKKQQAVTSGKQYMKETAERNSARVTVQTDEMSSSDRRRLQKQQEAEERRLQRKQQALEDEIHGLEEKLEIINAELCDEKNMTDREKLTELGRELEETQSRLDSCYEEWLELQ